MCVCVTWYVCTCDAPFSICALLTLATHTYVPVSPLVSPKRLPYSQPFAPNFDMYTPNSQYDFDVLGVPFVEVINKSKEKQRSIRSLWKKNDSIIKQSCITYSFFFIVADLH